MSQSSETPVPLSAELKEAIRKEAVSQAVKWAIAAFFLFFTISLTGWWFYLQKILDDYIIDKARGVPSGTVVAFDTSGDCPRGWSPFADGAGRFIVGAGRAEGLTQRRFRSTGDSETVVLSERNIPQHQHDTLIGVIHSPPWGTGPAKQSVAGASLGAYATALSSPYGRNPPEAIPIVPPFIALTFCKKD